MENTTVTPAPAPSISAVPTRRCRIEQWLTPQIVGLLEAEPNNETVRAMVLASVKQMPAPELDTSGKIKEWIEFNFDNPVNLPETSAPHTGPYAPRPRIEPAVTISVHASDVDYGSCSYNVPRESTEDISLTADDIMEAFENNKEDLDGLIDEAQEFLSNAISDNDFEMDSSGDYEYDNHSSEECLEFDTHYNEREFRNRIIAFLRTRLTEEQKEILGI